MAIKGGYATGGKIKEVAKVPTLAELYQNQLKREGEVYANQRARQQEIENILETQLGMYAPGGAFEQASLAELGRQKTRDIGAVSQRDISRGLYGIRPYEQEWESTVGAPARLKLEDILQQRRSQVLSSQAAFLERIEEPYPDTSGLMEAIMAQNQSGGKQTIFSSGGGSAAGSSGVSYSPGTPSAGFLTGSYGGGTSSSYRGDAATSANFALENTGASTITSASNTQDEQILNQGPAPTTAELLNNYNRYAKGVKNAGKTPMSYSEWYWASR